MGAPIIQDKSQVIRWMRNGLGNKEIVAKLWDEQGVRVTEGAVAMFRKRHGLEPLRAAKAATIPWTVKNEHANLWVPKMLRLKAKVDKGEPITASGAKWLENWLARIEREHVVVAYYPELEEGFFYLPREASDGDSLTRA